MNPTPVSSPAPAPSLASNVRWALTSNAFYAAMQFMAMAMLAKLGGARLVGDWALALSIATPIIILSNLKLRQVIATDAKRQFAHGVYLGLRCVSAPVAGMLVVAMGFALHLDTPTLLVLLFVTAAKVAEALSDLSHGLFQHVERLQWMARSQMLRGVTLVAALALGVGGLDSLVLATAGLAAAWSVLAIVDHKKAAALCPPDNPWRVVFDARVFGQLAWTAFPLGLVTMLGTLQQHVPRYFLEAHAGREAVGIYSSIAYLLIAGGIVSNALGQATVARLAHLHGTGDSTRFRQLLGLLVAAGALLGALAIAGAQLFGEVALLILFDPSIAEHTDVLLIVAWVGAVTWTTVSIGTAINAMRRFWIQLPIHAANVLAVTTAAAVWIPTRGLIGAAQALLAGAIVVFVAHAAVAWTVAPSKGE